MGVWCVCMVCVCGVYCHTGLFTVASPPPFIGPYNIVGKVANKYPCQ
jgi:hypothetical protein